jgi:hypothetical protein
VLCRYEVSREYVAAIAFLNGKSDLETGNTGRRRFRRTKLVERPTQPLSVPLPVLGTAEFAVPKYPKRPDILTAIQAGQRRFPLIWSTRVIITSGFLQNFGDFSPHLP